MTDDRVAIIDLGSNTFHLLICEINEDGTWSVIHKERIYVKLASGGLDYIDDSSVERGLDAMSRFAEDILAYNVKHVRAIGTAALREAKNGKDIAEKFFTRTGLG
jgi:exopolyphosphatase / guanosine-5'-triphosphate,3'-diphosphate pyrophosphatase